MKEREKGIVNWLVDFNKWREAGRNKGYVLAIFLTGIMFGIIIGIII